MKRPYPRPLILLLLTTAFLLSGCGGRPLEPDPSLITIQTPKPVIFDSDLAHEDMFAALFLLAHPNVEVRAITVAGTGEAHCKPGMANALGLVALSGQNGIPVACGPETPLAGDHAFPAAWRTAADGAYGVDLPDGGTPSNLTAPELIVDILNSADAKINIIAVGPLTNIAAALQTAPQIADKIEALTIMGGAVQTRGNVGPSGAGIDNEFAEWNIYVDPRAAEIVFQSAIPITLIPLDATQDVPITHEFYDALQDQRRTPQAELVYEILTANLNFIDAGGFQFWDTLSAAVFTDPTLASFEEMPLTVVQEEGPQIGRTAQTETGPIIRVATSAERARFEALLLTILNWEDPDS